MKVVLDANVLLAAFGTRGLCESLYDACLASHEISASEHLLHELRKHLVGKFKMPTELADDIVALVRDRATLVAPASVPADACRDADDLPILGTAVAGCADCLVTGDRDLLTLGSFAGVPILSPRELYGRLI
jgi:uncharacterized protein